MPSKSKPITQYGSKAVDKGKGKAVVTQWNSENDNEDNEDNDDDDDDEAYVTSNDYGTPASYASSNGSAGSTRGKGKATARDYLSSDNELEDISTNGSFKGKGKGKAVLRNRESNGDDADGFGDVAGDDEEELYG